MTDTYLEIAGKKVLLSDNGDGTYSLGSSLIAGTASGTEFAEDAAHTSGDKGVMALAVRKDTAAALAGSSGDYAPLEIDASGHLWIRIAADQAMVSVNGKSWDYLGAEKASSAGATSLTLPAGTTIVALFGETATIRYKVNGTADANSTPVADKAGVIIGPLGNLTSLSVFNAASSVAYAEYYKVTA